ncbi:MAG TPA: hypothetical protein VJ890_16025 [Vineibacter sp.]|nr:hypothetical protein [Vineibacter sp.]
MLPIAGAEAALPPYWQRAQEVRDIVASQDVYEKVRQSPIDRIERVGNDLYRIEAGKCRLEVRIVDLPDSQPPGFVGPRRFRIVAGEPDCR